MRSHGIFSALLARLSLVPFTELPELKIHREACGVRACGKAENVFPLSRKTRCCICIRQQISENRARRIDVAAVDRDKRHSLLAYL